MAGSAVRHLARRWMVWAACTAAANVALAGCSSSKASDGAPRADAGLADSHTGQELAAGDGGPTGAREADGRHWRWAG
jgi:hypothetical protein